MNACASARVRLVRSMPLSYSVLPSLRLLCIRGWGVITQRERIETMREWLADPSYPICDDALCDFSEASSTPTMAELRGLVELMAQQLPARGPRKLAIITSKPITFVVAGEFKEFVKQSAVPMDVEVFPDFQSGWTWLRPEESQDSKTAASHR
jgi:hypothetical protein